MNVNHNASMPKHDLPGLVHQTLAGQGDGLNSIEVWRQTISAGATTPVHRHDCEEVIVILKGQGMCRSAEKDCHFKEDDTLVIPSGVTHQICNTGDTDLYIIATLAMAPVQVEHADGAAMALPWYAPGG